MSISNRRSRLIRGYRDRSRPRSRPHFDRRRARTRARARVLAPFDTAVEAFTEEAFVAKHSRSRLDWTRLKLYSNKKALVTLHLALILDPL